MSSYDFTLQANSDPAPDPPFTQGGMGFADDIEIASGAATVSGGVGTGGVLYQGSSYLRSDIEAAVSGVAQACPLICLVASGGGSYYQLATDNGTDWVIYRCTTGTVVEIERVSGYNGNGRLSLRIEGSDVVGYRNGSEVIRTTDTNLRSGGSGFLVFINSGSDSANVTFWWDGNGPHIASIGTSSRDYSALQAWEDDLPATLYLAYEGQCYNDSEFTAGVGIFGHTCSAANYIKLTAAPGESFMDNDPTGDALYYDQSRGVGINVGTSGPYWVIGSWNDAETLDITIERLQIKASSFESRRIFDCGGAVIRDCIGVVEGTEDVVVNDPFYALGPALVVNCLLIVAGTYTGSGKTRFVRGEPGYGATYVNTTFVAAPGFPVDCLVSDAVYGSGSTYEFINCAVFGIGEINDGDDPATADFDYCATDLASGFSGGTGYVYSLDPADQFVDEDTDFRLKAGHGLSAGTDTTSYTADLDILGRKRHATVPDIGAFQYHVPAQSIGTSSRDYSTLQAWEDDIPFTPYGGYIGECYNDSEFTAGVEIAGHATSSGNFITLTAAAGESFMDDPSAASNPLYYDQSKGVGISVGYAVNGYVLASGFAEDVHLTIERLQARLTAGLSSIVLTTSAFNSPNFLVRNCIFEHAFNDGFDTGCVFTRGGVYTNCLFVASVETDGYIVQAQSGTATLVNCTFVCVPGSSGSAMYVPSGGGGGITLVGCAVFGYASIEDGTPITGDYCATDLASGFTGTGNVYSLDPADQFEDPAADFRLKAGNDLAAGIRQEAYTDDLDIVGQGRSTTTPCIGCWEFQGGGGSGDMTGSISASFTASGAATGNGALTGAISQAMALTGALTSNGPLVGAVSFAITQTGSLVGIGALAGGVSWSMSLTGALTGFGALSSTIPLQLSLAGSLSSNGPITGSVSASFSLVGSFTADGSLAGSIPVIFSQVGTLIGSGVLSSAISFAISLNGSFAGGGALDGVVSFALSQTGSLTGGGALASTPSMTMALTGAMIGSGALSGNITASFALTGAATGSGVLSGSIPLLAVLVGALTGTGALTSAPSFAISVTGSLVGTGALSSNIPLTILLVGDITGLGSGEMTGDVDLLFSPVGSLTGTGAMTGAASWTMTLSGSLGSTLDINGAISFAMSVSAVGDLIGLMQGVVSMNALLTGAMIGSGALSGLASLSMTVVGAFSADGFLVGSIPVTWSMNGAFFTGFYDLPIRMELSMRFPSMVVTGMRMPRIDASLE